VPDQVERIEAWIHARRLAHTNRPQPASALDSKFSLQYCLVRALLDRQIVLEQFEGDGQDAGWRDPRVAGLLGRVHVAPYGDDQFDPSNHFGGEVKVTLRDGRVLQEKVEQPLGRTSANPLPVARLREKFAACAQRALPAGRIAELVARIEAFETEPDVGAFTRSLES